MKRFEKLGYMALGAGILALGITIGQFVTLPIEAQNKNGTDGVFDKITCREIEVIGEFGKTAIELYAAADGGSVVAFNSAGKIGGALLANDRYGGSVKVWGRDGETGEQTGAALATDKHGGRVWVFNNQGQNRAAMSVNEDDYGVVSTWDKDGKPYRQ